MSIVEPAAGRASASGVRRMGDQYQDLAAWAAAVRLLLPGSAYHTMQMEMNQLGNLDDVVLRTGEPDRVGDLFQQLKWTTRESNFLDEAFMTSIPRSNSRSLLKKLYDSYVLIRGRAGQARFEMQLLTNRPADPCHPLLSKIDGRTGLLMPFTSGSDAAVEPAVGKTVSAWADHLDIERDDLVALLSKLRFRAGRDLAGERDNARTLMLAAGITADDAALDIGVGAAGSWVREGRREVTAIDVAAVVERCSLTTRPPTATLLIEDIDHDRSPETATVSVNWVSHYEEADPARRRVRKSPLLYEQASADLRHLADLVEAQGYRRVFIRGHLRQASAFTIGNAFPKTRGFDLEYAQGPVRWATDAAREDPRIEERVVDMGQGDDLAVLVATAAPATDDVKRFLTTEGVAVIELRSYVPKQGEHDSSVRGPGHAVGIACEVRQRVRTVLAAHDRMRQVHLFLAGPNGLAYCLGHRWNAVAPTVTYEHRGVGARYVPAFVVQA